MEEVVAENMDSSSDIAAPDIVDDWSSDMGVAPDIVDWKIEGMQVILKG